MSRRNNLRAALRLLLRDACTLARSWWRVDRIRVSPHAGWLLSLEPSRVVFIEGRPVEIVERSIPDPAADPCVVYSCRTVTGPAELRVRLTGSREVEITWRDDGGERVIREWDVTR